MIAGVENMWIFIGFFVVGVLISFIFTLFLVNFDSKYKVVLESIIGFGGSGCSLVGLCNFYNVESQTSKFIATIGYGIGFLGATIIFLFILCKLIKDKDDEDILRVRDILLGQKSYIEKYYETRKKEIDSKLNIPELEKREEKIAILEMKLNEREEYIELEEEQLNNSLNERLTLELPEKKKILITKALLNAMPSYVEGIFRCINEINLSTNEFINSIDDKNKFSLVNFKSYLISIITYIFNDIFRTNASDIRIHFRYYNKEKVGYDKLIASTGKNEFSKQMTIIPYNEDSLIKKSYECKRALIKSINIKHDYKTNNYTSWKDYMTYTFYNLKIDDIPYLSFGISVKNSERYKMEFYFMNYFMFEDCLRENIESLNEHVNLKQVIYGGTKSEDI